MNADVKFDENTKLSIYNPVFEVTRNELNIALKDAVAEMIAKGMTGSSVTLKIDISAIREAIVEPHTSMGSREGISIEINAKVAYELKYKNEVKLDVVNGDRELVLDPAGQYYMVSHEEAAGQLSFFSNWDAYKSAVEEGRY